MYSLVVPISRLRTAEERRRGSGWKKRGVVCACHTGVASFAPRFLPAIARPPGCSNALMKYLPFYYYVPRSPPPPLLVALIAISPHVLHRHCRLASPARRCPKVNRSSRACPRSDMDFCFIMYVVWIIAVLQVHCNWSEFNRSSDMRLSPSRVFVATFESNGWPQFSWSYRVN